MTNQFTVPAAILAAAIIIAAGIASWTALSVQSEGNVISVTGSTKTSVTADQALWRLTVSRRAFASNLSTTYTQVNADVEKVRAYLKENGIEDSAIEAGAVQSYEQYTNNGPREYAVNADIVVRSKEPKLMQKLSKGVTKLVDSGMMFQNNSVEYTLSDLSTLRVSLLADAIKDAKARAVELAKAGGTTVGALKSASSGVVQVLSPNSIEVSDYGSYDTQSLEKEVMVTARATFYVK